MSNLTPARKPGDTFTDGRGLVEVVDRVPLNVVGKTCRLVLRRPGTKRRWSVDV